MPTQSVLATRYYKRKITDSLGHDLTGDNVYFAFILCPDIGVYPDPGVDDWYPTTYFGPAEFNTWGILVGSEAILSPGVHAVWQKIGDDPETDVERVDILTIT